jgi:hypothetical protein
MMQSHGYLRSETVRGAFNLILDAVTQARKELQDPDGTPTKGARADEFNQLMKCPSGPDSDLTGYDLDWRASLDALNTGNWIVEMVPGLGSPGSGSQSRPSV